MQTPVCVCSLIKANFTAFFLCLLLYHYQYFAFICTTVHLCDSHPESNPTVSLALALNSPRVDVPYPRPSQALKEGSDAHPAAHASRLKISLAVIDAVETSFGGMHLPWDLTEQCAKAVSKLAHIGASCRIPVGDELQLLKTKSVAMTRLSPYFKRDIHTDYMLALLYNRKAYLQLLRNLRKKTDSEERVSVACKAPPRLITAPWPYSTDNTVLGAKYDDVVRISTIEQWEQALASAVFEDQDCALVGAPAKSPRLVIGFFWTPWMKDCRTVVDAVKDLSSSFPMVNFLHVEGDKIERVPGHTWPLKDVRAFPEFVLFRNGKQVASTQHAPRKVDAVTVLLQQHINATDRIIARAQRRREEAAEIALMSTLDDVEEMDWIWSEECMGDRMVYDDCGTTIKLTVLPEDADADGGGGSLYTWEVKTRDGWESFEKPAAEQLEVWAHGPMKIPCYVSHPSGSGNVTCRSRPYFRGNILHGSSMYMTNLYRHCNVRRVGTPFVGPALPEHCQTKGENADEEEQQQRRQLLEKMARRAKILKAQGKDLEAVRGGLCMQPSSGVHRWTLVFHHRPGRKGSGDAVGLCSSSLKNFGPCSERKVGGGGIPHSVGLFADGSLYYQNRIIARAVMPEPEKPAASDDKAATTKADESEAAAGTSSPIDGKTAPTTRGVAPDSTAPGTPDSAVDPPAASKSFGASFAGGDGTSGAFAFGNGATKPAAEASKADKGEPAEEEEELAPLLFSKGSEIAVMFDADAGGGTLSFSVDDTPVEFLWDQDAVTYYTLDEDCAVSFTKLDDVFRRFGPQAEYGLYPAVQLCPLDGFYDKLAKEQVYYHPATLR